VTVEEIVLAGFERITQFTGLYPSPRASLYRRISTRQQQLFARAAKLNPERFGTSAVATVDVAGAVDLLDISAPIPTPELIQKLTVEDPGASAYAIGTEITVVSVADPEAGVAPRVTMRDLILRPIGTETVGIATIRAWYSRTTPLYGAASAGEDIELPSPHDELLVTDIARMLLVRAPQVEAAAYTRGMESLAAEEQMQLAQFDDHVLNYGPWSSRFARPPAAPMKA
jgi:hypothetical protein